MVFDCPGNHLKLLELEIRQTLVDGVLHHHAAKVRLFLLAHAVHPPEGLLLHGGIPPEVKDNDAICAREVQGLSAALDRGNLGSRVSCGRPMAWVYTTKTYQNPDLLVVGKVPDCLMFLSARHASRIIEKINVLVLEHSANDTGNEDEGGKHYLAVSSRSWMPCNWFASHQ